MCQLELILATGFNDEKKYSMSKLTDEKGMALDAVFTLESAGFLIDRQSVRLVQKH